MGERQFGDIEGVPPGAWWRTRKEVSAAGIHRPPQSGICGTVAFGAESIVVSGGYEDDVDLGSEIIYTGHGGQDGNRIQVADQSFSDPGNAALVTSELLQQPVRVVRGAGGDPLFSPEAGYRYDGVYFVVEHWMEEGTRGFQVCRFRLLEGTSIRSQSSDDISLPAGNAVPGSSARTVTSINRDDTVTRAIKALYDEACQFCDVQLETRSGRTSDGAHIRPLGNPHFGPDEPGNVLCLCPNHHRLFDLGAIHVTPEWRLCDYGGRTLGPLTRHPHHQIDQEHLKYHRTMICGLSE